MIGEIASVVEPTTCMRCKTILLVEDNLDDIELTLVALRRARMADEVVALCDGLEALDYIFATGRFAGRDPNDLPGVLILDLNLPRMNGLEVLRRLRACQATKMLPVVILTASMEEQDIVSSFTLGVNSYLLKPLNLERFEDSLEQLGLRWRD